MILSLILLAIFWKPIYWSIKHLYITLYKREDDDNYLPSIKAWFIVLWGLVYPGDHK